MKQFCTKAIHKIFLGTAFLLPFFFILPSYSSFEVPKNCFLVLSSLILLFFFAYWYSHKKEEIVVYFKREFLYLAAFIGYMGISVFFSSSFLNGVKHFLPFFAVFIYFVVFVIYYRNEDPLNHKQYELIQAVVFAGTLEALVALFQFFGVAFQFFGEATGKWRVFGTMGNPNYVAEFLLPSAFLAFNMLNNEKKPLRRTLFRCCLVIIILGIFATFSRSGMLLLFGGFGLYLFYYLRITGKKVKGSLRAIINKGKSIFIPAVVGFVLIVFIAPLIRFDKAVIKHVTNRASIVGRVFIWKNSADAALRNLPFGAGIGDFRRVYTESQYRHFAGGSSDFVNNAWQIGKAHNDAIQLLVELGLGAIPFFIFIFFILRMGAGTLRKDNFSISIYVAFLALIVSSFINFPLRVAPNLFMLFLLAAFVYRHRTIPGSLKKIILNRRPHRYFAYLLLPLLLLIAQFPVRTALAHYYQQQGAEAEYKGWDKHAWQYYNKAACLDGSLTPSLLGMADYLRRKGKVRRAESLLQKALRTAPVPEALRLLALCRQKMGDTAAYVSLLKKRAYSYRKIVPYQADYIGALFDAGAYKRAIDESRFANRTAMRVSPFPASWLKSLERANGHAFFARMKLSSPVKRFIGSPNFTAVCRGGNFIYAGSSGGGLFKLDPLSGRLEKILSPGHFVTALQFLEGVLWVNTERGLFRRIKGTTRWQSIALPDNSIKRLTVLHQGKEYLWFASSNTIYRRGRANGSWRVFREAKGVLFDGIRSCTMYKNTIFFGGTGQLVTWQRKKGMQVLPVKLPAFWRRSSDPVLINSVYPFGPNLIGLCSNYGLLTYFVKGKAVVKLDFAQKNLVGADIFEKSIVVLTGKGRLILKDLRQLFTQINRDRLSRASISFTYQLIRRNYDNLVPELKGNRSGKRLLIFNNQKVKHLICAATDRGLLLQAGPWGAPRLKTGQNQGPHSLVVDLSSLGDTVYAVDRSYLWRYKRGKFFKVGTVNKPLGFKRGEKTLYLAAGNSVYLISATGAFRPLLRVAGDVVAYNVSSKNIAVASKLGVVSLYNAQGQLLQKKKLNYSILSLALSSDSLFIGTAKSGVVQCALGQGLKIVRKIDRIEGLPDNRITALLYTKSLLWIGTARGGVVQFEPTSGSIRRKKVRRDFFSYPISQIVQLNDKVIIALQGRRFSLLASNMRRGIDFSDNGEWPLFLSSAARVGDEFFIGGAGGVFRFSGFQKAFFKYKNYFGKN